MADVLIRGIEMPPNVEGCEVILRIQPNGEVLDIHKIHTGVTAIPLPERHGRLKDSDEIISAIKGKFDKHECSMHESCYRCWLDWLKQEARNDTL